MPGTCQEASGTFLPSESQFLHNMVKVKSVSGQGGGSRRCGAQKAVGGLSSYPNSTFYFQISKFGGGGMGVRHTKWKGLTHVLSPGPPRPGNGQEAPCGQLTRVPQKIATSTPKVPTCSLNVAKAKCADGLGGSILPWGRGAVRGY